MSSKIKVDTIENVAGSGNVSLGSGHNLVVPGDNASIAIGQSTFSGSNVRIDLHSSGSGVGSQVAFANDHNTDKFFVGIEGNTTGNGMIYQQKDADINFYANNLLQMRVKNDGEVEVASANDGGGKIFRVKNTSNTANSTARMILQSGGASGGDVFITFDTHNSNETHMLGVDKSDQRFALERQDAGIFDGTNRAFDVDANGKFRVFATANDYGHQIRNSNASPYGQFIQFNTASPDNNVNTFLTCADSSTSRLHIYSDGDIDNHDNSYGAMSDERIKQDIVDANSQWDDIKGVRVRNFKKKDDVDQYGDKAWSQIGVIAQELEKVSPKLIKEVTPSANDIKHSSEFGTLYKDGDTIPDDKKIGDVKEIKENVKRVNYSVLYMKAVKALQEAMTRIETLETKVKALELK